MACPVWSTICNVFTAQPLYLHCKYSQYKLIFVVVNIGTGDGVFRPKLGSWTPTVAHTVYFPNTEADMVLSK